MDMNSYRIRALMERIKMKICPIGGNCRLTEDEYQEAKKAGICIVFKYLFGTEQKFARIRSIRLSKGGNVGCRGY